MLRSLVGSEMCIRDRIQYYEKAAIGCLRDTDVTSCQVLTNLCTLLLYQRNHPVCQAYWSQLQKISSSTAFPQDPYFRPTLPWLYYGRNGLSQLNRQVLQMKVVLGEPQTGEVNKLQFFVTKYSVDGRFLGTEALTSQLQLCPFALRDAEDFKTFGYSFYKSCTIDLSTYLQTSRYTTTFYELFVKDGDGSLVPVPVVVSGFVDESDQSPNRGIDSDKWRFTRRFFLVDNLSARTSDQQTPLLIRYAASVRLTFILSESSSEKIYVPYLSIEHRSRREPSIRSSPLATISLSTSYTMNSDNFWPVVNTLFIIANVAAAIVSIIRIYVWTKHNPSVYTPNDYIIWFISKSFLFFSDTWARMMFFFLYGVGVYWLIFYKLQSRVFILIPSAATTTYKSFYIIYFLIFGFSVISLLSLIYRLAQIDVFFIDWEKSEEQHVPEDSRSLPSAWRTIFIGNELCELHTLRHIPVSVLLVLVAFLLRGLNLENLDLEVPYARIDASGNKNPLLHFAVSTTVFLACGLGIYVIRQIFRTWVALPLDNFIDLLSVANISLFILDENMHGFYIHGISPSGRAEVSLENLRRALEIESKGGTRGRGLLAEDKSQLQSYELYISRQMRLEYNGIFNYNLEQEIAEKRRQQTMSSGAQMDFLPSLKLPENFSYSELEKKKRELMSYLKIYLEEVVAESHRTIIPRSIMNRAFDLPPIALEEFQKGNPILFRDTTHRFKNVLFYGYDFQLLVLNILIYNTFWLASKSVIVAIVLTYLFDTLLSWLRDFTSARNLGRKTLIDDRFLS
eukprot:TRINITY_DN8091_c0_g2_i7.p1 TRINITY_DN8091_c0_g2~~TRINITY_DN8091_c0_g2_i7.p1  ORF type:complete len:792 (+),score=112.76 TRINITY_DN8091_c0_g2_i7:56-2431(+)